MSNVLVYGKKGKVKGRKRKENGSYERIEKFFIFLIIFLAGVILVELLFHFFVAPSLLIKKVEIFSPPGLGLNNGDVLKLTGLGRKLEYFEVKSNDIRQSLLAVPAIKSVSVKKVFPSKIIIQITGRTPVGVCFTEGELGNGMVAVDKRGILFPLGRGIPETQLPVISGIKVPSFGQGARLPKQLCSFLEDLERIRITSPLLYSVISEVKFVKKSDLSYDVVLFPVNSRIRVRIGDSLDTKMLKYIVMMLDVISSQPSMSNLEEIDLRGGEAVYRIREE